jgi:hypothetical protein
MLLNTQSIYRVFLASLHDMNFRRWYFMDRQECAIISTTHEDPITIERTGSAGPPRRERFDKFNHIHIVILC